jgi:TonB family protein
MSYKSLLFCPDEKAAQVVTQVLSELDFTVEIALEPFATVKKLTDEHYDALVVDCHNEQDASLLFKAARNSAHNHSSLSVAVVEGQAGVAKAFRIGANLVLTKPINAEQSKGTLRVARGLLRKNDPKSAKPATSSVASQAVSAPSPRQENSAPAPSLTPSSQTEMIKAAPAVSVPSSAFCQPVAPAPAGGIVTPEPHIAAAATVPYSSLEVEKDPTPEPEAADLAVLESLPKVVDKRAANPVVPSLTSAPEPIAASTAGSAAAAAAPALEKKPELKLAGAPPMVTNQPIVREETTPEPEPVAVVPTFSTLDHAAARQSGGSGFLRVAVILVLLGGAGYFGWQKFHPLQYLHRNSPTANEPAPLPAVNSSSSSESTPPAATPTSQSAPAPTVNASDSAPTPTLPDITTEPPTIPATSRAASSSKPEEIEVQEMPMSRDMKVPPPTRIETVQPLVVKTGGANTRAKAPVAPTLALPATNSSSATLSNLISTNAALPKPAPNTVRISQGVSQGLLLKKVPPAYPAMALQLHKEGVVQLLATISKTGDIANVKVLSGDSVLAKAAADAVLRWKYRPYLLDGVPVEVETQISIVFKVPQ